MTFEEMLQDLVNQDDEFKVQLAAKCFMELLPTLRAIDPEHNGMTMVYSILGTAAAVDGELSEKEMYLLSAMFKAAHQTEYSADEVYEICETCAGSENVYNMVRRIADALPSDQFASLINMLAAICSIDDKISSGEYAFLKDLVK